MATAAKSDPCITLETVIGHFTAPPRAPCLVCGDDGHVPEECPIPGTSVLGHETYSEMVSAYLTKHNNKGQCYICKAYHIQGGKYGDHHFTSKKCLHLLLTKGTVHWDRKESLLEWSKDHRKILNIPEPKRQRGLDGRPIVKKPPEQQFTIKTLDKVFKQLKDQRSVPMVFQLMRYLAKKGLGPISEGEAQTLKQYIQDDQRNQSLEWIKGLLVERQTAFEVADDHTLWKSQQGGGPPEWRE